MKRKRCTHCGVLTYEWEIYNGDLRCWPCGRLARIRIRPDLFPEEAKALGIKFPL